MTAARIVQWDVNGKTIEETRMTDMAPERLAAIVWSFSHVGYRVDRVSVDGRDL